MVCAVQQTQGASASSEMSSTPRSSATNGSGGGVGGPPPTGAAAVLVAATLPPESAVAGAAAHAHALGSAGVPATAAAKQLFQPLPPTAAATSTLWPRLRHFIAGYASGAALVMVGHPFDLVKVRLQTEGASGRFRGPLQCVMATVRSEGVMSLYKGVTPPLLGTGVINALVFGLQGLFVGVAKGREGLGESDPATLSHTVQAAMATGAVISLVVTPIEGIKSRLQTQYHALGSKAIASGSGGPHGPAPLYTGPRSCIAYVLKHQGVQGLYRGWLPVVFCRMSNWAYFGGYHFWKGVYARAMPNADGTSAAAAQQKPTKAAAVFSGGMAGISYWFSCYPMDLIKARMMANPNAEALSIRSTARTIWAREGWRGFFAGFTPCLARAFPANAAAFLAFEWTMAALPE